MARERDILTNSKINIKNLFFVVSVLALVATTHALAGEMISKNRFLDDKDTPWRITAKSLSYSEKQGLYVAKGDVKIAKGGQTLYSEEAKYNKKSGIATVSGDVRLEAGGDVLTGDYGTFNLQSQTGRIENGRLFLRANNYYISGESMEKTGEATYVVKNAHLTTCDDEPPDWSITGSEIKITIEGYGHVKHTMFRVKELPFLYFPYMIFPAKTKRQTGLLPPRLGYSSLHGLNVEIPFFWAISDQTDATFYQHYMYRRGYMQGLEFRYIEDKASKGDLLFDILSDRKEEKKMYHEEELDLSPFERTNTTRYWARGKIDQNLPLDIGARMDVDFLSDQDYLREFNKGILGLNSRPDLPSEYGRPLDDRRSTTRRSALRLDRDTNYYSLQGITSYYQRPEHIRDDTTSQPLLGLDFVLFPDKLLKNTPLLFNIHSDYDHVWRDFGQKGHRLSVTPEMTFPAWLLGDYLAFETRVSYTYNSQWLDEPFEGENRIHKTAYEVNSTISATAEKIYDLEWRNVRKLRNEVSPELSYRYRVHHDKEDYRPWFEPVDQESNINGIINLLSLTFEDSLHARSEDSKGNVSYRQWASMNVSQGYNIVEARRDDVDKAEKRPFQPLLASLTIYPISHLDLRGSLLWDHYETQITSASTSLELSVDRSGGKSDSFVLNYLYENEGERTLDFSVELNLLYGFSVGGSMNRNLKRNYDISKNYWIGYQSQCWGLKFVVEKEDRDTSFLVVLNLLGLGEFEQGKKKDSIVKYYKEE